MNQTSPARSFFVAAFVGGLGGGALILTTMLTRRGQMIFLPYGALIITIALYLRWRRVASFATRFGASVVAFMLASIIMDSYIITIVNPAVLRGSLWHLVWPMGVFLLMGSVVSAIVAKAAMPRAVS